MCGLVRATVATRKTAVRLDEQGNVGPYAWLYYDLQSRQCLTSVHIRIPGRALTESATSTISTMFIDASVLRTNLSGIELYCWVDG